MFGTGIATFRTDEYGDRIAEVVGQNSFLRGYAFDIDPTRIAVRPKYGTHAYVFNIFGELADEEATVSYVETVPVWREP